MTELLTANDVVLQMSELGQQLDAVVNALKDAEMEAVVKRHAADLAESRAFVAANGAVELRKHLARLQAAREESDALVAEATLRYLRARIRALDTRIDIGRSYGATVRAELKTVGYES